VSATLTAFESVHFIVLLNLISSVNTPGAWFNLSCLCFSVCCHHVWCTN